MIFPCLQCVGHALQDRVLQLAGSNTSLILLYCREEDNIFPCELGWPGITIEYDDDMSYDAWSWASTCGFAPLFKKEGCADMWMHFKD
jgi:hypothetical protein